MAETTRGTGRTSFRDAVDAATLRSRQRFARRQWRRRWLAWRYLAVLGAVLLAAVVMLWLVYFSSVFAAKSIDVTGLKGAGPSTLTAAQVRRAADVPMGTPLVKQDLDAIRARVLSLDAVASVDVSREWPDKIRLAITERVPVAVVEIGGKLHALDVHGDVFGGYAKAPRHLPKVETPSGTSVAALGEAARVAGALPSSLLKRVDHVEVRTVDQVSLRLHDGRTVVWGSADQSAVKAQVLAALMKARPRATHYDVSVPGQPVVTMP